MSEIKKIHIGTTDYDISAKYIQNGTENMSWQDILDLVDAGFDLITLNELPTADASAYATYKNKIVLVPSSNPSTQNQSDEFVIQTLKYVPVEGSLWFFPSYSNLDTIIPASVLQGQSQITLYEKPAGTIGGDNVTISVMGNANGTQRMIRVINQSSNEYYAYINEAMYGKTSAGWYLLTDQGLGEAYTGTRGVQLLQTTSGQIQGQNTAYVEILGAILSSTQDSSTPVGTEEVYSWEQIGTTAVDVSGKVDKGTYTTNEGGAGATGSAGEETITTSNAGSQNATGTVIVTYDKATQADSAGGQTVNSTEDGGFTIDFSNASFTGTSATVNISSEYTPAGTISVSDVPAHSHTINIATITTNEQATVVTGVTSASLTGTTVFNTDAIKSASLTGTKTFITAALGSAELTGTTVFATNGIKSATIDSKTTTATGYKEYVESVGASSLTGTTSFLTGVTTTGSETVVTEVSYATASVLASASVDANGVLSFSPTDVATSATGTTASIATGLSLSTGTVNITNGTVITKYMGVSTTDADTDSVGLTTTASTDTGTVGITTTAASTGQVEVTGGSASGTTTVLKALPSMTISQVNAQTMSATFYGEAATITATAQVAVAGSISGKQTVSAHSHSVTVASHTHAISTTATTITGTAAVAVSSHTHSVTVASHTHSISNHTHEVVLQTPSSTQSVI